MTEAERQIESRDEQKERIRKKYKGINADELDVILAKPPDSLYEESKERRVAVYARVSTGDPRQTSSYELQKNHYLDVVDRHPGWKLVEIYADEGISGTSLQHRDEFVRMIRDCERGKIDLIVTKSVSRFARNVLDCIGYVRQLGEMKPPVGVLFETEGIYTLDHRSEMQLSFMATTAQEESHNKSEIMNASIEMRFRRGIFLTPKLLGYDLDSDGNLVVNEEEAKTVRLIFFMYLYGYSTQQIADTLEKYGRPTKKGRIEWSPNTVLGVLQNERHCGDVLARKTWTPNYLNHKSKKNRQDRNQYRQKNHHEAIISRDDFIAVQKMIANAKYGNKGILPELHVIATGALRGFVSVHPRWAGFSVKDYHKASESVYDPQLRLPDEPQNIVVDEGSFDLRGYEIARSQFITSQNQLTCTMGIQELKFGIHGIRKMDNVEYVELLIHPTEKALAVRKSTKANKYAIWWAQPKDGVIVPRKIAATSFMKTIFEMLGWRDDCRYRVRGVRKQDENETVLVFDLQDTEVFLPHQTPPSTDEEMEGAELQPTEGSSATRSPARVSAYPAEWVESFGDEFYRHVHTRDPKGFSETADWQLHAPGQVFNEDPLNTTSREEIQLGISSMLAEMDNTGVDSNE